MPVYERQGLPCVAPIVSTSCVIYRALMSYPHERRARRAVHMAGFAGSRPA